MSAAPPEETSEEEEPIQRAPAKAQDALAKFIFWLSLFDANFLDSYADRIRPDWFKNAEEEWFLSTTLTHYLTVGEPMLVDDFVKVLTDKKENDRFDKDAVVALIDIDPPSDKRLKFMAQHVAAWVKEMIGRDLVGGFTEELLRGNLSGALRGIETDLAKLKRSDEIETAVWTTRELEKTVASIVDELSDDGTAISTGLEGVDDIMVGGLRPGELGVILAPTGKGKSHFLIHLGRTAWIEGKNVLYYSLEMSETRVNSRFFAGIADVKSGQVAFAAEKVLSTVSMLKKKKKLTNDFVVQRYGAKSVTVAQIQSHAQHLMDKYQIHWDLILIDYGDIIASPQKHEERRDTQDDVYAAMREMSLALKVPIWTASQANRQALKKETITLDNIADSIDKAKHSDYIIALCQTDAEKKLQRMRLFMAKSRNADQGEFVQVKADLDLTTFEPTEWAVTSNHDGDDGDD